MPFRQDRKAPPFWMCCSHHMTTRTIGTVPTTRVRVLGIMITMIVTVNNDGPSLHSRPLINPMISVALRVHMVVSVSMRRNEIYNVICIHVTVVLVLFTLRFYLYSFFQCIPRNCEILRGDIQCSPPIVRQCHRHL